MSWIKRADYQGWVNYETWNMNLWIDNTPETQAELQEICQNAVDREESADDAIHAARSVLQDAWEARKPELDGVFGDLLTGAFSEIRWYDIVKDPIKELWTEKTEAEEGAEEVK